MLNKQRLLTPGPTPLPEVVRLALSRDMIHHRKKDFQELMLNTQKKLRILFGTSTPVLPLACSGTGAMTAAVYSLFKPGEKVLVIEAGKFGQRWRQIAQSRGLVVESIIAEWGSAVEPGMIMDALDRDGSIKGVLMQLCETSTAVLQPVKAIAGIVKDRDALLVVDGISAVGISPCPMDAWQMDCLLTGSQKGLMLPPGLALIALSPRAWEKAEKITPGCFYFNLPKERDNLEKGQTHFTTPVNLIFGLDASLDFILAEGLDAIYKKQWAMTMLVRTGTENMGLSPLAKCDFAWGVTAVRLPGDIPGKEVLRIAQEEYGVIMAGGQGQLKGRIVRIGHMGWVDWADCLAGLHALDAGLCEAGNYHSPKDYTQAAMTAYRLALAGRPGEMPATSSASSFVV